MASGILGKRQAPIDLPQVAISPTRAGSLVLAVFLGCVALFLSNGRLLSSGDNLGTRASAAALATSGSIDVTPIVGQAEPHYSWVEVDSRLLNSFPLGTGVLAAPIYLIATALPSIAVQDLQSIDLLEKVAAAILTATGVALFALGAIARFGIPSALAATAVLALGTPVLTTMSQGLWSHTGEFIALSFVVCLASNAQRRGFPELAGFALAVAFFCRPTALFFVPIPLALAATASRAVRVTVGALLGGCFFSGVNYLLYGSVLGGYGLLQAGTRTFELSRTVDNIVPVLISPSKGLVWFFPLLIVCTFVAITRSPRRDKMLALAVLAVSVSIVGITASYSKWWGGHSIGPRLLAELSIPCALAFGMVLRLPSTRFLLGSLKILATWEIGLFVLLLYLPAAERWSLEVAVDANRRVLNSWKDSQLWSSLTPDWKYVEEGPYFNEQFVEQLARGLLWRQVDLAGSANSRYDLPPEESGSEVAALSTIFLPRLVDGSLPESSQFRILPTGRNNVVRVCGGEPAVEIAVPDFPVSKLETLLAWRGDESQARQDQAAWAIELLFVSGKRDTRPLRFGQELVLRRQLDPTNERLRGRFYGGSISAPDGLQRQRFSIPGKDRVLTRLTVGAAGVDSPGCIFLFAVSLGVPGSGQKSDYQSLR